MVMAGSVGLLNSERERFLPSRTLLGCIGSAGASPSQFSHVLPDDEHENNKTGGDIQ
jgi:hypothetical protein